MVEINLNIAHPEKNESANETLDEDDAVVLHGMHLGDEVSGEKLGFDGGTFEITGGSDRAGFPMRKDTPGIGRHKVLIKSGTGLRKNREGRRVRRTVAGNTIYEETAQVNLKVVEDGSGLFEEEDEDEPEEADEEEEPSDTTESNGDSSEDEEKYSEDEGSETSDNDTSEKESSEGDASAGEDKDVETDSDEEGASDEDSEEEESSSDEDEIDSDEESEKKSES